MQRPGNGKSATTRYAIRCHTHHTFQLLAFTWHSLGIHLSIAWLHLAFAWQVSNYNQLTSGHFGAGQQLAAAINNCVNHSSLAKYIASLRTPLFPSFGWDGEYSSSTMPLYTLTITLSLTITCTCCCDGIYGAQGLKIYSHANSLILALSDVES